MTYSEKEALKQHPEASSWPKLSCVGEYYHMDLIDYIDGLLIDVPSIQDCCINARLKAEFKGHASIWYTEIKEIHGRRNWPWWKSQIIQKYRNGTWIWQKTMSFENDKYSVDKHPYEWCLRQSRKHKAIDPQINTQMRNKKLLTQMPGELEHGGKSRCNHNCTLVDIANTLQDVRKRANIGKYTLYRSSGFKEKQPFSVDFKDKPRERVAEVEKQKNNCHNCGLTDHYANNCPKENKKFYSIEEVPEEESPTGDSESDSMGDAIREHSDDDQDPREEFLVEYQEENPLEIQDIQLEEGRPGDTANKNLCKPTQDAQPFLVTPAKGMAYIHGTATKMTVCIENSQNPLIIDSGAHCSIVARNYLDNHFLNCKNQLLPTKEKNFKSASGNMTSIGTIIKEIIIPHRKGNIRLNPEFVVLDDAHIQGFLLGKDYQTMYGIDIYNSRNRRITIGTNKLSTTLPSKQKLSLLKFLRKNRPAFAIGEEPLGKIRDHDIELYLDVEGPYPPIPRRPAFPESRETRKEIEKPINELLDMDVMRKIVHNEIVEIATPVLITWHDGKYRLCGDFRALNNSTKAYRYPIPRISDALDKLAKPKYITKMDCMKGFYQNGVKPNSMKLLRIMCHMGIYEYTRWPFGIKNAAAYLQRMMGTMSQEEILPGWMVVYIDDIIIYSEAWKDHAQYIDRVLSKYIPINLKISLKKCNFGQQELLALEHKFSGLSL
ncbi:hypothetical protein O181_057071 [Austropuccinia psidii MF-1]|uniref:CCHC-type domain-containing protein n=1 Tax=Austropuccinia psidii MF-1 TaxID=1389203 RepID=A0A9Q3EEF9_9BASI|nr:hypothetical protein [Austropuccinia psidii MF-1]